MHDLETDVVWILVHRYGSGGNPDYTNDYLGPLSNCTDFSGSMPGLAENLVYEFNNTNQTFSRESLFFTIAEMMRFANVRAILVWQQPNTPLVLQHLLHLGSTQLLAAVFCCCSDAPTSGPSV